MNDLEITKLCAEALGIWHDPDTDIDFVGKDPIQATLAMYNPLVNDAQAMALVKKFGLHIFYTQAVAMYDTVQSDNADLNRAICECVAKMIKEKVK